MIERTIECKLLTPLFSHGACKMEAEYRASELKGAMRYTYRIISRCSKGDLLKEEQTLFGGSVGEKEGEHGHASPIRLMIIGQEESKKVLLIERKERNRDIWLGGIKKGKFKVILRMKNHEKEMTEKKINRYENLAKLALLLCGMGQRSRKARGSVEITGLNFSGTKQALEWICEQLNANCKEKDCYTIHRETLEITASPTDEFNRPVIQRIQIGEKIANPKEYLNAVDFACHKAKDKKNREEMRLCTGSGCPRLASPLIIRILKIKEEYYPLYTFVKVITEKNKPLDDNGTVRIQFIKTITTNKKGR